MLTSFFKTAYRNIFRHKLYVFINVFGLAVGYACSLLIFLFVIHELNFDTFNEKYNRIYRVYLIGKFAGSDFKGAYTAAPTAKTFVSDFPEVEAAVRMQRWDEVLVRIDDRFFIENKVALADSSFFDIFSIRLQAGDPKRALNKPNQVVLTQSQASKYFGPEDPMGKSLRIGTDSSLYTVSGIMEDVPENSHFDFDFLISFLSHDRAHDENWLSNSFFTYVLLKEGVSAQSLEEKFPDMLKKYLGPQIEDAMGIDIETFVKGGNSYGMYLQPLSDVHLDPTIVADFKPASDRKYIYIFSGISLLILIVAAINYMNLSTARSARRSREVGLRKVVGSTKRQLVGQFMIESVLLSFLALLLAIVIVELLLPFFNNMLQLQLSVGYFSRLYVIPGLITLALAVGILAGSYPALFMSSFVPVKVLYGRAKTGYSNLTLRSTLVVIQFAISIGLILSSLIIYRQIRYMLEKDMGFDNEQLMVIRRTDSLAKKISGFKENIRAIPGVVNVANSTAVPGYPNNQNGFQIEGRASENPYLMQVNWVDYDYFDTYRLQLAEGRYFSRDFSADSVGIIINKQAVRNFDLKDPFNTWFIQPGFRQDQKLYLHVLGIVKDFHFQPLQQEIAPHVFMLKNELWDWTGYITIRLQTEGMDKSMKRIADTWNAFTGGEPLQYFFLDSEFEKFYKEERRTARIAAAFSILAIIIAGMGLFGLTSFSTEQRAREISLRKVHGSPINGILTDICAYRIKFHGNDFMFEDVAPFVKKKWWARKYDMGFAFDLII